MTTNRNTPTTAPRHFNTWDEDITITGYDPADADGDLYDQD